MIGITEIKPPRDFVIERNQRDFSSWESAIRLNVNETVDAMIVLLEGRKNAAPLYKQIKRLFLENYSVANQVVLVDTIRKGKNLISIATKIAIQIQAK
jgi:hypothetical protein